MIERYGLTEAESETAEKIFVEALKTHRLQSEDLKVEMTMVDAAEMRALNLESRQIDRETDVLSFPAIEIRFPFLKKDYPYDTDPETGAVYLGEILICRDVMRAQAEEYGHGETRECAFLMTHGMMHLLGYDHIEDADRTEMRAAEEAVLRKCGYTREEN